MAVAESQNFDNLKKLTAAAQMASHRLVRLAIKIEKELDL
jgi:hypothetical protein